MAKSIVSISFLYANERVRIGADKDGLFPIPRVSTAAQRLRPSMHPHTAKEFVEHEKVKFSDPVLTLSDGSKLRVYLGGDPTGMIVLAASAIDNHDTAHKPKPVKKIKKIKKPEGASKLSKFIKEYKDNHNDYDLGFDMLDYPDFDDYDKD